ncbi:hypothetical protein ACHQM5_001455 [Ranunculus cassubicifolius]
MAVMLSSLTYCPENTALPLSKCLRSEISTVACLCNTSLSLNKQLVPALCFFHVELPSLVNSYKTRTTWPSRSSVDGIGFSSSGNTPNPNGRTRLIKAIQDFQLKLNARLSSLKKDFPMKVLFFLVGFYCSTAFATVIGQTGDWDILSAGLAVVVVEGVGALMYKGSFPVVNKVRSLITMFNFWKAGLSMGLFLDAFKYEMDDVLGSWHHLFDFDIDVFPTFF